MILLLLSFLAHAETPSVESVYDLQNLRPVGISQYNESNLSRAYLQFQNEIGLHYIVYEEQSAIPGIKEISTLKEFMSHGEYICSLEIHCTNKAFCTGECSHMYYEFSNSPVVAADRNKCSLRSFSCEKGLDLRVPASATAPLEAPALAAPAVSAVTPSASLGSLKESAKKMEADPMADKNTEE